MSTPTPLHQLTRTPALGIGVAALLAMGTRLPFLPGQLVDHDSVNFARALHDFDLSRHSPHLPGYPAYVAAGRLAQALGASDPAALAWPAVLGAVLASIAITVWLGRTLATVWVWAAVAGYLLIPGLWLADARPLSDGLGAHLVTVSAVLALVSADPAWASRALALGRWAVLAAASLLAVRLSSWPVALGVLAWMTLHSPDWRERVLRWALFAAVTLAWLVPLAVLAGGPAALTELGWAFAQGHMAQWRGDGPPPAASQQALQWIGHLWSGGAVLLAAGWVALAGLARRTALGTGAPHLAPTWLPGVLAGAYLVWIVVGQNPDRPRHILPVLGLLAVALMAQLTALGARLSALSVARTAPPLALAVCALAATCLPRLAAQRDQPSPDMALGAWLATQPPEGALVLGGSEVGVLRWQAPAMRSLRVASPADLTALLRDPAAQAPRLYASSRVPGLELAQAGGLGLDPVQRFAPRSGVDLPEQALVLYQLRRPATLAATPGHCEDHL